MTTTRWILLVAQLVATFLHCQAATSEQELLDWIGSKRFVSDKIVWKKANDNNESSGLFAIEDIPKGTHLMRIAKSMIIGPDDGASISDCSTVENLLKEYQKGKESESFPFIDHLFGDVTKRGINPSSWTIEGKTLLRRVIGRELEPQNVAQYVCADACPNVPKKGEACSALETAAYFFIVTGAWGAELVPGAYCFWRSFCI